MQRPNLARTSGVLGGRDDFRRFLAERFPQTWMQFDGLSDTERAAAVIRAVCGIRSRRELDSSAEVRRRYDRMIGLPYSSWRRTTAQPVT